MESRFYGLVAVLLVLGLIVSAFVVPVVYTWSEVRFGRGSVGFWVYNVFESSVVLSVLDVFLFMGFFVLDYVFHEFYLGFNQWVFEVRDMGFWFNRGFSIWLFAKNRKRWAKWSSGFSAFVAVYVGALVFWFFSARNITGDVLAGGVLVSVFSTGLFAWLFYKYYTSRKPRTPTVDHIACEERRRDVPFHTR